MTFVRLLFPGNFRLLPLVFGALLLAAVGCGGEGTPKPPPPGSPILDAIEDIHVTEEEPWERVVTARDPDGDALSFSASGLPSFAAFTDRGDGTGLLRLTPALGDAGTYAGLRVTVTDGTLADSVEFSVRVDALPRIQGGLFYEPPGVCATEAGETDSISVYNLAGEPLYWRVLHVPAGLEGVEDLVRVEPRLVSDLVWQWNPPRPWPVDDSLVVATNDLAFPRVVIRFHMEDPSGEPDITPPDPPLLAVPRDGARFVVRDSVLIRLAWSELDDCSGIQYYKLDIAATPDFSRILCCRERLTASTAELWAYPADAGVAYWRVSAVDNQGLHGPFSQVRSWTVEVE